MMETTMGITFVDAVVAGPKGRKTVEFLIDTGAWHSLLPITVWRHLGLKPMRSQVFTLADGTHIERQISECRLTFQGRRHHVPVILGRRGDDALMGATSLEILGLVFDPLSRTLKPMRGLLMELAA
jgi:clan AA aspartic protease